MVDVKDTIQLALLALSSSLALLVAQILWSYLIRPKWLLRKINGPPNGHPIKGHIRKILDSTPGSVFSEWHKKYGGVLNFNAFLSLPRMSVVDRRALQFIFVSESYTFEKPAYMRRLLAHILGEGVLIAEGNVHQRQRKIMNPSFGPAHMKSIYPIFIEKSLQLRDHLMSKITASDGPLRLDFYSYTNRAALDVVCSAGFGYEANSIDKGNENELAQAFDQLVNSAQTIGLWQFSKGMFPWLRILPDNSAEEIATVKAKAVMQKIGAQLVAEKKRAVEMDKAGGDASSRDLAGKDLLSILVRSNMSQDLRPSQRMSDQEVMDQISTFLLAGNDTTANSMAWAVYGMCKHPEVQEKLRAEAIAYAGEVPSYDDLNNLPYLDAVIRETLRVYSPVAQTSRVATKDIIVPLSTPVKDVDGKLITEFMVPKNAAIMVPIAAINKDTSVWGPDAEEFNPERWLGDSKLPEGAMEMPSLTVPTFIVGPRSCIGFRFSVLEMKAMIFSLVKVMKLELADHWDDIEQVSAITTSPRVRSRKSEGYQLPVILTPVEH